MSWSEYLVNTLTPFPKPPSSSPKTRTVIEPVDEEEFGDEDLNKEKSLSTEIYLRKKWGDSSLRLAIFDNDYEDFIQL